MDGDRLWRRAPAAIARFAATAAAYDRYRPGYPAELFDDLAARCGLGPDGAVLEVGAGTGMASVELARRCATLVCLEPAPAMAARARAKLAGFPGATVVEATFEAWTPSDAPTVAPADAPTVADVVCAANAWPWLDPAVRWAKAASLLEPRRGHLALIAHELVGYEPDGFAARLAEVGGALNPALAAVPEDLGLATGDTWAARIAASGHFEPPTTSRYPFSRRLDGPTFVAVLGTYGVHAGLPPDTRRELDRLLADLVKREFGGAVVKHERAVLQTARASGT